MPFLKDILPFELSVFQWAVVIMLAVLYILVIILIIAVVRLSKGLKAAKKKDPIIIYRDSPSEGEKPVQNPQTSGAVKGDNKDKAAKPSEAPEKAELPSQEEYSAADDEPVPTVEGEIALAGDAESYMSLIAPPVADETVLFGDERNSMRYNRSFRARLIQSDDKLKEWYGKLKNEILSYENATNRISWKYENFSYKKNPAAKFFIKGKTLCLYLALNPSDYADSKYGVEDAAEISMFADTPALYRIKSDKRVRYATELIAEVFKKLGTHKTDREPVDYYEPYNGTMALIEKGLVKRVIEDADESFIGASSFNSAQDENSEDEK